MTTFYGRFLKVCTVEYKRYISGPVRNLPNFYEERNLFVPFAWGPAHTPGREALAYAMLRASGLNPCLAGHACKQFAADVLSKLPAAAWSMRSEEVLLWVVEGFNRTAILYNQMEADKGP